MKIQRNLPCQNIRENEPLVAQNRDFTALAAQLLEQRLAACIALQPQQSLYHWQGRIEKDSEVQLVIKTNAERLEALEIALHQLHSYDVPEWIVLSGQCSEAYGSWLSSSLKPPQPGPGDAAAPGL